MTSINNFIVTPKTLSKPLQTETPPLEDNSVTATSTPENAQTPSVPADIMTLEDYYAACNAYNINDSDSNLDLLEVQENPYIIEVNYDLIKEKAAELGLKLAKGYYSLELPEKHSYLIYMDKDEINTYVWDVYNQEFVLYDKTDEKTKAHLEMIVAANVKHLSPTSYYGIFISEDMSSHYDFSRTIYRWNPETQGFDMLNNTELNELNLYNLWEHIDNVRLWQLRGCDPQTGLPLESKVSEESGLNPPAESTVPPDLLKTNIYIISEEEAIKQGYTIIKTSNDLIQAINKGSGNLILMSNIDLTNIKTPLDSYDKPFTGTIDFNGYIVSTNPNFTFFLWGESISYEEGKTLASVKNSNFRTEYKHEDQTVQMENIAKEYGLTNFNGIEGVYYSENEYGIYLHIWDPRNGDFIGGFPYRIKDEATNLNIYYESFEDFCKKNGDATEYINLLFAYQQGFDIIQTRSGEVSTNVFVNDGKNYICKKYGEFTEVVNSNYINYPEGYNSKYTTSDSEIWNDYKSGYFWSFSSPTVSTERDAKLDDSMLADIIHEAIIKKAQELGMTYIYPTNNEYVFVVSDKESSFDYVLYYDIATGIFTEVPVEKDPNAPYLNKNATPALVVNPNEYEPPKLPEGYEVAVENLLKEHPELKETASPYVFMFAHTYKKDSGEQVSESVVYYWNPNMGDFEKFVEKRIDGTQYMSEGTGIYLDAYKKGFFPTPWENIYEKDGIYYQFTEKPGQHYYPKAGYYKELTPAMIKELTGKEIPTEVIIDNNPSPESGIDDSSNDYFAQMDKVAEENGYVKTDTPGKYIYTDASGANFVCIWDLTNNKFLLFRTNSSEPSENDLDENDMAVEQNVETLYAEATIKAYKEGYKPTDRFGIYEKDGLFYEYDIDKKEFIPFDNEELFEAKVDEGARPIKRTLANIYLAANMLAMIYGYTPTATLGVYKDADNNYWKYDADEGIFKQKNYY